MRAATLGVALPIGLMLLSVMTLMGVAGTRLGALELQLSRNDESQVQALQQAQSMVDWLMDHGHAIPDGGGREAHCLHRDATHFDGQCAHAAALAPSLAPPAPTGPARTNVLVRRLSPSPPPPGLGFSADRFGMVQLRVAAVVDGSASGEGRAQIEEGLALLKPLPAGVTFLTGREP